MQRIGFALLATIACLYMSEGATHAGAAKTTYPVVFAHGMGGFNNLLGYDYWGDDYGTFVGDPCDALLEVYCNGDIDSGQKAYVAQVQPFQTSEARGGSAVMCFSSTSIGDTPLNGTSPVRTSNTSAPNA